MSEETILIPIAEVVRGVEHLKSRRTLLIQEKERISNEIDSLSNIIDDMERLLKSKGVEP